jgi:hypothetical protein
MTLMPPTHTPLRSSIPKGLRSFEEVDAERQLAQQRLARLAELSRKARHQQASPEEVQELERLENEAAS